VHYATAAEPPLVADISGEPADLVDALCRCVADCSIVPAIAVREIIENLAHADYFGASVSVLNGGATVRVADCGPGIDDKARAMRRGYSTATPQLREIIRGVGSGLAVCMDVIAAAGGTIDIDDNLTEGTVVTLRCAPEPDAQVGPESDTDVTEQARRLLAVLLEIGPTPPDDLARELGVPLPVCTRELVLLEQRGMVNHAPNGVRELTDAGTALLTTLF
jgi:hypothetical protein